jgi:mitogen-activated protein kinase 15
MNASEEDLDLEILAKYKPIIVLGKGAYGIVWKAQEKRTKAFVALKKVLGAFNNDVDSQRTYREVYLLQSIRHPNIVRLLNVHRAKNDIDLYLVFEYVHTDLQQLINEGFTDDDQKTYICYQIFSALTYLHSLGVVHRDLKPANILINSECIIKLADFGLARTVTEKTTDSCPIMTEYVATKIYRAPEVLLGSSTYSYPIDIWSVGCIVAELFASKPPKLLMHSTNVVEQLERYFKIFGKPSEEDLAFTPISKPLEILKELKPKDRFPLSSFLGRTDAELIDLITRCLTYNPQKRITALEAIGHPFFKSKTISTMLSRLTIIQSDSKLPCIIRDDIRLSSIQYKRELYRLIIERKTEIKLDQLEKKGLISGEVKAVLTNKGSCEVKSTNVESRVKGVLMSGALLVAAKQAELSSGEVLASKFGTKNNKSLEKPHPNLKSVDSLKKPDD